jgi:hypothetical protein
LGSLKDRVRIPDRFVEFEAKKSSRRDGGTSKLTAARPPPSTHKSTAAQRNSSAGALTRSRLVGAQQDLNNLSASRIHTGLSE